METRQGLQGNSLLVAVQHVGGPQKKLYKRDMDKRRFQKRLFPSATCGAISGSVNAVPYMGTG
ncbi:uncharacterized protein K460DRAFT_108424 [Cucurbitaria berberidis CBS 394.84]|uniref:Uncharacterized protein n=1 Tax=Cucurbitaria berberidis CBS 394.84 TaxID=1168544 RepID=A0A9P4GH64_9PLEO|nr:uncharacterized protein K460DRAFT_108424 [Cucurbitaria berberidis CBS 394.84]KAF1845384.1 hypothetical protein K460DRAFT_108424 [Cucurbitaria berberidis CBS 394.84]